MSSNSLYELSDKLCIVCDTKKNTGIHLYTSFICEDCEKEIVRTETSDPKYQFFLERLSRVKRPPLYS
ncbi:sigma factor G inhibitor Gin [Metabacillus malikii]|uniref:Sigma factor G inhibitor Gin n=1 Tax=Metabacillus malikii TaxID=1504265 RepID=A0ABT9ZNJ3_9BACI|nr:sigma factor G inhibitor Gin [Metabacillus malikii]MDQ0233377.1 hypothetical protein [Metabacillus malikii]